MKIGIFAQVNQKGQFVIPKTVREKLGIDQNTNLNILMRDDGFVVYPIERIVGKSESENKTAFLDLLKKTQGAWAGEMIGNNREKRIKIELAASKKKKHMVILDTNIVIDHLRQPSDTHPYFYQMMNKNPNGKLAISIISVQELYEGKSARNEKQEQILLTIISHLNIIPYSYEVAKLAGIIARDSKDLSSWPILRSPQPLSSMEQTSHS